MAVGKDMALVIATDDFKSNPDSKPDSDNLFRERYTSCQLRTGEQMNELVND